MSNRKSCVDCKFFSSAFPTKAAGECRKNAPTLVDEMGVALFPKVKDDDWCGDFQRPWGLYDLVDDDDADQDYDVDLPDYDDECTISSSQNGHFVTQQDLFEDRNEPDDGRFDEGADYHNPYQDWENKDSAIDSLCLSVATLEETSLDLETDVDSLKDFREWSMKTIEKLQKELQILKQPKERIGW